MTIRRTLIMLPVAVLIPLVACSPTGQATAPAEPQEGEGGDVGVPASDPYFGFKQAIILALGPERNYRDLKAYMGDSFQIMTAVSLFLAGTSKR